MSLSYKPLWDMLEEKGISKMEFAKSVGISNATLAKLGKDEPISLTTVDKICNEYDCDIENVVKYISSIKVDDNASKILNVGTIIVSKTPIRRFQGHSDRTGIYHYVITDKKSTQQISIFNNIDYSYKIASLSFIPSSNNLYISIPNLKLETIESKTCYLRLDTIRTLPEDSEFQIIGSLPQYLIDKIIKFNDFMATL